MPFRLASWLFLVSFFLLGGLNSSLAILQSDSDIEERIAQGKRFMAGPRVDEWKKYLDEVPNHCRKMSLVRDGKRLSDYFYIKNHSLVINHATDGSSTLNLRNPKYVAEIRKQADRVELGFFRSGSISPHHSPLCFLSIAPGGHSLWAALESGLIEVANFRSENDMHFIKFVPLPEGLSRGYKFDYYEVRINDQTGPLPDKSIKKNLDGSYLLLSHYDHIDIKGFKVPTKQGSKKVTGGESSNPPSFDDPTDRYIEIKIEPEEELAESIFYLPYYGLPEPPKQGQVADFSEKPFISRVMLLIIGAVVLVAIISIWVWRKSNER